MLPVLQQSWPERCSGEKHTLLLRECLSLYNCAATQKRAAAAMASEVVQHTLLIKSAFLSIITCVVTQELVAAAMASEVQQHTLPFQRALFSPCLHGHTGARGSSHGQRGAATYFAFSKSAFLSMTAWTHRSAW